MVDKKREYEVWTLLESGSKAGESTTGTCQCVNCDGCPLHGPGGCPGYNAGYPEKPHSKDPDGVQWEVRWPSGDLNERTPEFRRKAKPTEWRPMKMKDGRCGEPTLAACKTCPLNHAWCAGDPDFKHMQIRWWPGRVNKAEFRYIGPGSKYECEEKAAEVLAKQIEEEVNKEILEEMKSRPQPRPEGEMGEDNCHHCQAIIPRELALQILAGICDCIYCGWRSGRCKYCKGLLVLTWNSQKGVEERRCQDCHHLE